MVRYDVTIDIRESREAEWVRYMLDGHIRSVLDTGCFLSFDFHKVREVPEAKRQKPLQAGFARYVVEYKCESMDDYQRYIDIHADRLRKEHIALFENDFEAERSVVKVTDVVAEVYYGAHETDNSDPTLDRVREELQLQ